MISDLRHGVAPTLLECGGWTSLSLSGAKGAASVAWVCRNPKLRRAAALQGAPALTSAAVQNKMI